MKILGGTMRRTTRAVTPAEPVGEIVVTLASTERTLQYEPLGLTYTSTDEEVLNAVAPIIEEEEGVDILEDGLFTVKSVESSQRKFLFPKSPMG